MVLMYIILYENSKSIYNFNSQKSKLSLQNTKDYNSNKEHECVLFLFLFTINIKHRVDL